MKNNNIIVLYIFFVLFLFTNKILLTQPAPSYGVKSQFSSIQRRLLIKQGILYSADINDVITNAIPVGDGTYYFKLDLIRGGIYNFIFQAKMNNNWVYEQIPNTGAFPTSTNNNSVSDKKGGTITRLDNGNVRREITVPINGDAYYVFCNFGHHPNPPTLIGKPGDKKIILTIKPIGRWGYLQPDVVYGGKVSLYKAKVDRGPYTFLTNLYFNGENSITYTNKNLVNGTTYYYVAIVYDAYNGTNLSVIRGPLEKEIDVPDYDTYISQDNIDANMFSGYSLQDSITPEKAIKVIFKVENIKWDVVKKNNYLVWLTPWNKDGRLYFNKLPGRILRIKPLKKIDNRM